jgi:TP901 family phage tail tape measure protein
LGKQAVILQATTVATEELAVAQVAAASASRATGAAFIGAGSASARLDAALLGLRTLAGSAAVIGLGALALAAIAAGKALRATFVNTAEFEQELNTFRAVAQATEEEMNAVADAAERLGADVRLPAVSAADAAVAMTELAKAGLSVQEAIAGAEGVLQLATAAQIDNAAAAEITANALNAFGLAGDQAVRVADDLANAANAAQGSIADFGVAMQQVAAVGRQVGFSLEETTALLTLLAKNGLRGSDAGTSLRVALLRLVAPTKEANTLIETLGINIRDAQGNVRPDVFAQFAEATALLGPSLRDAATAAVFGQDAIRAVAIAGREGAEGLRVAQFEIDQQGTAAEVARARTEGLAGAFGGLGSQAETLSITIGKLTSPTLTAFINALSDVVSVANRAAGALEDLVGSALDVETPIGRIGDRLLDVVSVGIPIIGEFRLLKAGIGLLGIGSDETANKLANLRKELGALQLARVEAERGGLSGIADDLTRQIRSVRAEIRGLRIDAGQILPPQTDVQKAVAPLKKALDSLQQARIGVRARGVDTSAIDASILKIQQRIAQLIFDSKAATEQAAKQGIEALASSLKASLQVLEIDPTGELANKAVANVKRLISRIEKLGPQSGEAGKRIGRALIKAIQEAVIAAAQSGNTEAARTLKELGIRLMDSFEEGLQEGARNIEIPLLGEEIAKALLPAGIEVSRAQALGTRGDLLSALAAEKARIEQLIASRRAHGEDLKDLFDRLAAVNAEIEAIQNEITSEVETAQKDRQQKFFDRLEEALRPIQRLQIRALGTESLRDDIKFGEALVALYRRQIEQIRKTLGNTKAARDAIATIQEQILLEVNKLREERKRFREQLRRELEERQERIRTGIELDIELAQITENRKAEIRARQRLLAELKKEIKEVKRGTNEWKRLRNAIAEEQAAIRELKGQTKDRNREFRELTFQFLQMQQGFAANLLGNLIPLGATAGLVGNVSTAAQAAVMPPSREVEREAQIREGRDRGVSAGQGSIQIQLLRQILHALLALNGRVGHPEARHQERSMAAMMDIVG